MQMFVRSVLLAALSLAPASALAQGIYTLDPDPDDELVVIEEPAVVAEPVVVEEPVVAAPVVAVPTVPAPVIAPGGVTEGDAQAIAMAAGLVSVEDVDHRVWDGNFEVEGEDASGDDAEILIDGQTGAILEIDD